MSRFAFISTMALHPWGGSEELWSRVARRLREDGQAVAACVPLWPQEAPAVRDLRAWGVAMHNWRPPGGSLWDKVQARATAGSQWNWLRRFRPDLVVVSQGGVPGFLESLYFCRRAGLAYALLIHANAEWWWPTDEAIDRMRDILGEARKIFCVSRHNLEVLRMQVGMDLPQAEVVWNPTNLRDGTPPPWPGDKEGLQLACVGRLEPGVKGQDVLFQVLAQPKWRERSVTLNLYGTGWGEQSLRRLAGYLKLERVVFHGQVADVNGIWARNHALVLPSRAEGLPLVLAEAMWCERPAVVSAVGGNSELCVEGETGFIAAAPTVELFDDALERAWQQQANWPVLGQAARARVAKLVPSDAVEEFRKKLLQAAL